MWAEARNYSRFLWGLRNFFKQRLNLEEAQQQIRQRLENREEMFLRLIQKGVYGNPRSPYRPLLALARCEFEDIRRMVRLQGLEGTLHALLGAGIYVTFEEFKGREPMVRDGREFPVRAQDFDNPFLSHRYFAQSGGSTGAGTRTAIDLDHLIATSPYYRVAYHAHQLEGLPVGLWRGILPSSTGLNNSLRATLLDSRIERWFTPVNRGDLRPSFKYRAATWVTLKAARLSGVQIPSPEYVPLDEAVRVARWAAETAQKQGGCLVRAFVSLALRVCLAAREAGIDLTGVVFFGGGEPLTPAKEEGIRKSGARFVPNYVISEVGPVGIGCVYPLEPNDLHFSSDSLALIQHSRRVPGFDLEVPAFCLTTLLPTAPKLLLNVESDDYGILEPRSCGCFLEACGWKHHLRGVRSFRKLTGDGMTLVGSEMLRILEEVLPARFGGSPLDYQLREEEDSRGLTKQILVVSPRIQIPDEDLVLRTVWDFLAQGSPAADLARATWQQGKSLQIRREEPHWTERGKLLPLDLRTAALPKRVLGPEVPEKGI